MRFNAQILASVLAAALLADRPVAADDPVSALFQTSDGVQISGDYYPPMPDPDGAPIVILLHMYNSDRSAWQPLIAPLHDAGFAVLAIDLRGHGLSASTESKQRVENRDPVLFAEMDRDVWAAYDWLAQQPGVDRARFGIVGASVGCSVALRYAALDRSVDAIVCMTPGVDYLGLDSKTDIRKIKGRSILLMATHDEYQACEQLGRVNSAAKTRIYDGAAHGTHMFGNVKGVEGDVVEFLVKGVGKPSKQVVYGSVQRDIYHLPGSGWIPRISPTNLRHYSSRAEAESRGLRLSRSTGPSARQTREPG